MTNDQKVIVGFLCGVAAGTLAGLLLAPSSGEETRKKISEKEGKRCSHFCVLLCTSPCWF